MSSAGFRPVNEVEGLIHNVFTQLEGQADSQIAELHYENQLRRFVDQEKGRDPHFGQRRPHNHMRPAFKLVAILAAIFLLSSWAGNIPLPGWDDGQQITLPLPANYTMADYMHWVAIFANRSNSLAAHGGHSLIVDAIPAQEGGYLLQLSVLGVDVSTANEWFRSVLQDTPELAGQKYQITQPQVSYEVTVKEMLAYQLGQTDAIERRVVYAWTLLGEQPSPRGMIYLIAGHDQYPRRVGMLRQ